MKRAAVMGAVVGAVAVVGVAAAVALSLGGGTEPVGTPTPSTSVSTEPRETRPAPDDTPAAGATVGPDTPAERAASPGGYVDYSESALAAAEGTRVLFFHAPWCPQCRSLEADILSSGVPDGITVIKVDYDTNQHLRQRYGVTLQTTVVALDDSAGATASFVAYDEPTLAAALAGLGLGG